MQHEIRALNETIITTYQHDRGLHSHGHAAYGISSYLSSTT